ncbi:flagellar transcriptional activator FlhD [Variovorax sp. GrIS 2.14]|uniref:flagellar transcriptional regulator FlhD n=1 Tax=Variovorax sp. GrIS 2.14 TaxID=3071709 RepID=UPI0038F6FD15
MTNEQVLAEIREANLTYLMLAQSLIRLDKAQALFRLGISLDSAELIAALSPAQILKLASGNTLLCRFRGADDLVWSLLTGQHRDRRAHNDVTDRLHAQLVMSSRYAEALEGSDDGR